MKKIASFTVDHTLLDPGIYVSRIDGDITTYDLRTRKPNGTEFMDNSTMHTFEHMFATYIRSSQIGERVIYFGPMGCQTGFYLLVRAADNAETLCAVLDTLSRIISHEGEIFGKSRIECGNYKNLDIEAARREAESYLRVLNGRENTFKYEE